MKLLSQNKPATPVRFRTAPLSQEDLRRLGFLAIILLKHYLNNGAWTCLLTRSEGSLTIQQVGHDKAVIKLFMDHAGELATKVLDIPPTNLSGCVIGIETNHLDPYQREAVRDMLVADFDDAYSDPRASGSKVWLQPVHRHVYDVAFFRQGHCPYEIGEEEVEAFVSALRPSDEV